MATTFSTGGPAVESLDAHGISVSVSPNGSFFDSDFAAAIPVHFHNLDGKKFLGVFSQRWHSGSRSSSDPNMFSAYTVDSSPSWAVFDGINGQHYNIAGQFGPNPPTKISHSSRVLTGACSHNNSYLFLMQRHTANGSTFGVVSHFHIHPLTWQVSLIAEEAISDIYVGTSKIAVTFGQGIKYEGSYLIFAGSDSLGRIYMARKNWGKLGGSQKRAPSRGYAGVSQSLEYLSDKGWSQDSTSALPIKDVDGAYITSAGPVSFGSHRSTTWISVLENAAGVMTARVYESSGLWSSWTKQGSAYGLGTVGSTYLGGTVFFQPVLRPNASRLSETCVSAIPVVYSTKGISGSNSSISTRWDLWPVPISGKRRAISADANLGVNAQILAERNPYIVGGVEF
jgi:hypothetical protein